MNEEIEHLLTDLMFVNQGKLVLNSSMDDLAERYAEVAVHPDKVDELRSWGPISEQQSFGRTIMLFEDKPLDRFKGCGELRVPSIADLFVAKIKATRK